MIGIFRTKKVKAEPLLPSFMVLAFLLSFALIAPPLYAQQSPTPKGV